MIEGRVLALIEEATQAEPGSVTTAVALAQLDGWDSMGIVMFLGELDDKLHVDLTADDLQPCVTVADLVALVLRHAG